MNSLNRRKLPSAFAVIAMSILVISYQNCSPGFKLAEMRVTNLASTATGTPAAPAPIDDSLLTDKVFAPTSFWYTPIPATAPLHVDSNKFAANIIQQKNAYYGTITVHTVDYCSPIYIPAAGTPTTTVVQWDCQGKGSSDASLAEQWTNVPIPANAVQSPGNDGEMTIYQPATDTIWEFWQARKVGGQWQACWGGRMQNASKNSGAFDHDFGTTATSLPFLGGQITAEELKRGEIRHVIGISLVDMAPAQMFSWPARRSDGNGRGIISEGQRFRLDPTVDVETLPMSRVGKIIARAAQKYGFVVWDTAGAIGIRAQNTLSYQAIGQGDPYRDELFSGQQEYQIFDGLPLDRLQFLPIDYGKN